MHVAPQNNTLISNRSHKNRSSCHVVYGSCSGGGGETSLPVEILEDILEDLWLQEMPPAERIHLKVSTGLVSKMWSATLSRVTSRYVYIPSSSRLEPWRRTPGQDTVGVFPAQLCHSITRQVVVCNKPTGRNNFSQLKLGGKVMRDLLSTFRMVYYLPNLRRISTEYWIPPPSGLDNSRISDQFKSFHGQIIQMEVEYRFPRKTPTWLVDTLCFGGNKQSAPAHAPWSIPQLEQISTAMEDVDRGLGSVLELCPHLEVADETLGIGLRVVSSSRSIPKEATIVHGSMVQHPTVGNIKRGGRGLPAWRTVRGVSLGLVLHTRQDPSGDSPTRARVVHVLTHRRGNDTSVYEPQP